MKSSITHLNPLDLSNADTWEEVDGSNGNVLELTVSADTLTGYHPRLTKFKDGYSTDSLALKAMIILKKYLLF